MKNLFIILFLFLSINCSGQVEVDKKVGVKVGLNDTEKIYQCPVTITAFTGDTLYFRAILNSPYIYVDGLPESPYIVTQPRSEEHTSELQSRPHLVCRLLLEKKK